jgi:predicted patatin/cPLA2 family phospholipase
MDFAAILANPVTFHPLATDAETGASIDLHPRLTTDADVQAALRATTCLPILAGRPVEFAGRRYVDSGISESVPVPTALAQGATHVLVLRTRRADEVTTAPSALERRVVGRFLTRHAPGAVQPWLDRRRVHAEHERDIAANPAVLQIRPPAGAPTIGRIGRDMAVLDRALVAGQTAARDTLAPYLAPRVS